MIAIKSLGLLVFSLIAFSFLSSSGSASILRMLSNKELINSSDSIVVGDVVDEYSAWDPSGRFIVTYTKIQVVDDVMGTEGGSREIIIRHLGGRVGNREMEVHGGAKFMIGEKTLLFLKKQSSGFKDVLGLSQGKFKILKDSLTGSEFAVNPKDPEIKFLDSNFKTVEDPDGQSRKPVSLTDFIQEIKKELKEGNNINQ